MKSIDLIVMIVLGILLLYYFYQWARNDRVYRIRIKWLNNDDARYPQYSYDEMYNPSKKNWFGLKFPKDKHFKDKTK